MLHVQWRGFDETEATWEPLDQLNEDVPEKVAAYVNVKATAAPALAETLKNVSLRARRRAGGHMPKSPSRPPPPAPAAK